MDTPLEESNLAFIGSDEDKAAREVRRRESKRARLSGVAAVEIAFL